jgi:hypothetical protein
MTWRFKTYVSENGRNDVQKEVDSAHAKVIEQFKARLRYLANTPKLDWHEPHAKKLQSVEGIYEIRFKASGRQHRPLGFFGPGDGDFTILVWAEKKQNVYKPADAINTAAKRRSYVVERTAGTVPLTIDGEEFPPLGE